MEPLENKLKETFREGRLIQVEIQPLARKILQSLKTPPKSEKVHHQAEK